jgi:hypothetical protein
MKKWNLSVSDLGSRGVDALSCMWPGLPPICLPPSMLGKSIFMCHMATHHITTPL